MNKPEILSDNPYTKAANDEWVTVSSSHHYRQLEKAYNEGKEAQRDDTYRIMEQQHRQSVYELWEDVICPMCVRLNPQHENCHYCHDREEWQALKSQLD